MSQFIPAQIEHDDTDGILFVLHTDAMGGVWIGYRSWTPTTMNWRWSRVELPEDTQ